ncbi:hypothetical protein XA68_12614 [Ophiocordyceps unilateralis]|uniref:Uncharacterized protein n=1 Tax=Ophiocordyceps unilateralis TaxID=268505 RepID=A0A2A9PEB7_OPHUN|nr:hypothetical protein XA68_12614 [Ophiocordyceps unilateralis]
MAASINTSPIPTRVLIKDNNNDDSDHPRSPPPAYALKGSALDLIVSRSAELSHLHRVPLTTLVDTADDSSVDSDEALSAINLSINTSVTVSSNNNTVCLADPASNANAIAHAVVKALQDGSAGQCGIPMIDEDGRPRPLRIHVDAALTVKGAGNIVGNESAVVAVSRRRGWESEGESEDEQLSDASSPSKRRCCE